MNNDLALETVPMTNSLSQGSHAAALLDGPDDCAQISPFASRWKPGMCNNAILRVNDLKKAYRKDVITVPVLHGVNLEVNHGEFVSIVGQSGSGKSTLLHLIGLLDAADSGSIEFDGKRIDTLATKQRDRIRNEVFGFVFQFYHLLPELTALENVMLPLMIGRGPFRWFREKSRIKTQALSLLERVGLGHRVGHKPRELSGGEMQRTALARALITKPRLLLADEPTGNLDDESGSEVIRILRGLNKEEGLTILMVTHNLDITRDTDRIVKLGRGLVVDAGVRQVA
jgi:lipoprotein-releasing system ATP-binding protein